jgi:lipopolysaccharide export system protein LptA
MADNVAITAGSGTTVGTDERTINSVAVQVQRVDEQGSTAIATGQVVVTTTSATLVAARDTRKRVVIHNNSGNDIWLGPGTVTTANGFHLEVGASVTLYTTAVINALIASGTMSGDVDYIEEYDS